MNVIPIHPEFEGGDPYLSHAGAASEPVREFDPVAYLRQRRRVERAEYRRGIVRAFVVGLAVGIVLFSLVIEVAT